MIYDPVDPETPVSQGDIFIKIPRIDINLDRLSEITTNGLQVRSWSELQDRVTPTTIAATFRAVTGIVISQDCDATRSEDITFCEIQPFGTVYGGAKNFDAAKISNKIKLITTHSRQNSKWFYLPSAPGMGLPEASAVDFRIPIRVLRENVESLRYGNRVGRLNKVARSHFREKISDFFRRYAYDEWYALSREELEQYQPYQDGTAKPFPWQDE